MSNQYEDLDTEKKLAIKKGLTWAEYSIILAILSIAGAFGYGWHIKAEAEKTKRELKIAYAGLEVSMTEMEAAKSETAKFKAESASLQAELSAAINKLASNNESVAIAQRAWETARKHTETIAQQAQQASEAAQRRADNDRIELQRKLDAEKAKTWWDKVWE